MRSLVLLGLGTGLCAQTISQNRVPIGSILNAEDEAHRQARIAITGDLGFPPLPPLRADSPLNTILFADRQPVSDATAGSAFSAMGEDEGPEMVNGFLPMGPSGTGTSFPEIFKYQLPTSYDSREPPVPLVVAYHGFGGSANSVAASSLLEEECEARGWIYMAPTGIDDQLFGSPVSQQNTEAAIQFMIDSFTVDPERIYAVGFSMGAGVLTNFAARRRDPDGVMIAALGLVSGTYDWTFSHADGTSVLQEWLENQYNFSGPPSTHAFNYNQSSGVHFDPLTYPPSSYLAVPELSMAANLADLPVYMTYDSGDTIPHVPGQNDSLETFLIAQGASVTKTVVSGSPVTHSWGILDEVDLLDFFDGKTAVREPADFEALQDLGGGVSWATSTQRNSGAFTVLEGSADTLTDSIAVTDVENATSVVIDVSAAAVGDSFPLRLDLSSADIDGFQVTLTGFDERPSYIVEAGTNTVLPGVDSDPFNNALIFDVDGNETLSLDVLRNADWTTTLSSAPNPAPLPGATTITIDAPDTTGYAFMILAISEQVYTAKGVTLVALAMPPAIILQFTLNASGDRAFSASVPNDPMLSGLRMPTQVIALNGSLAESVSNVWGFRIQ
ncbi:MAG: hypothetical protein DHS20C15_05970 [Planctomycetota bacterium]|nr:MAG: hypothetical protein DHS20C15_05970 [Planctomycetota bacterium]